MVVAVVSIINPWQTNDQSWPSIISSTMISNNNESSNDIAALWIGMRRLGMKNSAIRSVRFEYENSLPFRTHSGGRMDLLLFWWLFSCYFEGTFCPNVWRHDGLNVFLVLSTRIKRNFSILTRIFVSSLQVLRGRKRKMCVERTVPVLWLKNLWGIPVGGGWLTQRKYVHILLS